MVRSKAMVLGCVFACVAIVGLASTANAAVIAGVVGGAGVHMQYGPQNAGGDYLGIASESYEALTDWETGWWAFATGPPPDGVGWGFALLAFDPYTGDVWSQVPDEQQALGGAGSYTGHAPTVGLNDVDGGGNPISSDVVQADMGRGYTEDTIYITSVFVDYAPYYMYSMLLNTSSDGGILAAGGVPGVAGERALLYGGEEIRPYLSTDPAIPPLYDPTYDGDVNFDQTKTQAFTDWWYDDGAGTSGYAGHNGEGGLFGFEMDGIRGWMQLDFSPGAGAGGVRLTEYYFDLLTLGDFDGDSDVDADDIDILCDNMGGPVDPYDMDEDGDVDEDDVIELIETLVEWDNGVDTGVGTKQGDFNLDGLVNATDLAIMKATFGTGGVGYAGGNANCDDIVNATDLAILKSNFGFTAPTGGAVPEPATLLVMAAAGLPLLLKRKRKSRA